MSDKQSAAAPRSRARRTLRSTRSSGPLIALASALTIGFVLYTWLVVHWSPFIRLDLYLNHNFGVHSLWPVLHVLDRIGQRAICLPILFTTVAVMAWRHRSWRPALLAVGGVFVVNLLVLIAKLALSRGRPLAGQPFFSDGDMYPSGHTANILVVYGLCYHLITHYGHVADWVRRLLAFAIFVLSLVMLTTSLLLRWHWFSDLVGGFLIGGAVLALVVGVDAALPFASARSVVLPSEPGTPAAPSAPSRSVPPRRLSDSPASVVDRRSRR